MKSFLFYLFSFLFLNFTVNAADSCIDKVLENSKITNNENKDSIIKANKANLFFDTSVNMEGFINPSSSAYKLFVSELIKKTPLISNDQSFHTYFANINTVDVNDIGGVTTNKKFYQCPGKIESSKCSKIKTKLSSVLTAYDKLYNEDQLTIIITDLFLNVDELVGKNRKKISTPLSNAIKRGESIGIFGIESAYQAKIFGICTGNDEAERTTYDGATSRPFFVLLIGDKDVILNFKQIMDDQVIPVIGSEKVEFNLYTNDIIISPYLASSWPSSNFKLGNGVMRGDVLENERGDIVQFLVKNNNDPLGITIDLNKIKTPYTLPISDFSASTQTFIQMNDGGSCADQWYDTGNSNNVVYFNKEKENIVSFDLFNKKRQLQADDEGNFAIQFSRNFNYIMKINFEASTIAENSQNRWMEQPDWTFSCEEADKITDPKTGRVKFPVLNLKSFSELLNQIQKENFDTTTISQLNLAIHLSK